MGDDECPGEERCAISKNRPIYQKIVQITTAKQMREVQRNPPRDLVEATCNKCPLKESKPGVIYYPQNLLAAAEKASTLNKRIKAGITYTEDEISPRCLAALVGLAAATNQFENLIVNEGKSNLNKPKPPIGGEGYIE